MTALSREKLLSIGMCCGNGCQNCPYVPRHVGGSKQVAPVCFACQGALQDIRGKLICKNCHMINETCCDGGQCTR